MHSRKRMIRVFVLTHHSIPTHESQKRRADHPLQRAIKRFGHSNPGPSPPSPAARICVEIGQERDHPPGDGSSRIAMNGSLRSLQRRVRRFPVRSLARALRRGGGPPTVWFHGLHPASFSSLPLVHDHRPVCPVPTSWRCRPVRTPNPVLLPAPDRVYAPLHWSRCL